MKGTHQMMWHYTNTNQRKYVKDLFKVIIEETEAETKKEAVKEAKRYILNNWEGIMNQYNSDYIGCSAEGHISHILSSRLSSRPLSWCKKGVHQMARLRAFKANEGNVYEILKEKRKEEQKELKIIKLENRVVQRMSKKISEETIDNIPVIQIGKRNWQRELLKSMRSA